MKKAVFVLLIFIRVLFLNVPSILSEESNEPMGEVMAVDGGAELVKEGGAKTALKEGDLVKPDSVIQTQSGTVDIAFDKEWNNVVRVETASKAKIASVYPSKIEIQYGGLFAKLKKLPKTSTFEVQTPTAVAAVRGTEYRAVFKNGETQVYNFSSSQVFVYGVDAKGQKTEQSTVLTESQKTQVTGAGEPPKPPQLMNISESQEGRSVQSALEEKVKRVVESGRVGKIQDVTALEAYKTPSGAGKPKGESRVTDSRRRDFKLSA